MAVTNEAFSRTLIDEQLRQAGWKVSDGVSVRFESLLSDGGRADYLLCDRDGRGLAVMEAKRSSIHAPTAAEQAKHYAELAKVPYVFLANGREVWFWDYQREAHPRQIATFYSQADLERRVALLSVRRNILDVPIDKRIVERDYQFECIETLCTRVSQGRRKLLVEMATGTGKTRTAAALIKRLFGANAINRVLFLVDRITLANQTEEAFSEFLPELPCYVLRSGRSFDDARRITITTLQSMVNIYRDYSSGYFDLVISDECHRSIYGKWSGVLKHFDGIQIGLTATPCYAGTEEQGDDEDRKFVRDTLRFFEVDKPTFSYDLRQAIAEGWLVPYQIYKARTVQTAKQGGIEVKKSELDWSAMDAGTRTELEQAFAGTDTLIVDPSALERRFTIPERNRAIVREFREVMDKGYHDANGILRKPVPGKTVVFAVTKRHAETLARMFDEAYADRKPNSAVRYADYVVSDTGRLGEDSVDGLTKIRQFKKQPFPQILVSVNMLDTGFDFPELMNLVFARYTHSEILYRQMRGRGTRRAPGKGWRGHNVRALPFFEPVHRLLNGAVEHGNLALAGKYHGKAFPPSLIPLAGEDALDALSSARRSFNTVACLVKICEWAKSNIQWRTDDPAEGEIEGWIQGAKILDNDLRTLRQNAALSHCLEILIYQIGRKMHQLMNSRYARARS